MIRFVTLNLRAQTFKVSTGNAQIGYQLLSIEELKNKTNDFGIIFDVISKERILAMVSIKNKIVLRREQQAIKFESVIELAETSK